MFIIGFICFVRFLLLVVSFILRACYRACLFKGMATIGVSIVLRGVSFEGFVIEAYVFISTCLF